MFRPEEAEEAEKQKRGYSQLANSARALIYSNWKRSRRLAASRQGRACADETAARGIFDSALIGNR